MFPDEEKVHYLAVFDKENIDDLISELRKKGLFPLPDRDYTAKYIWFRKLSNSPTGLSLLTRIIPLIDKEP